MSFAQYPSLWMLTDTDAGLPLVQTPQEAYESFISHFLDGFNTEKLKTQGGYRLPLQGNRQVFS